MSEYGFCPTGGMDGIRVSDSELSDLSDAMKTNYLDRYINLPELSIEEQVEAIKDCKDHDETEYFERDNGSHGWCCKKCGTTVQWG